MNLKLFIVLLLWLLSQALFAQQDTIFWFVAPEISQGAGNYDRPTAFRISTYDLPADITVSQPANPSFFSQTISLGPQSSGTFEFPPQFDQVENTPPNAVLNKGFLIRATAPISAYYEVICGTKANPEIYSLKGSAALGTLFFVPFQNILYNSDAYLPLPHAAFDIVATENNTTVTITPTKNIVGHSAGNAFTITLNKGQTYAAEASSQAENQHPSGSKIVSNKPIAVTIKDDLLSGAPIFQGYCRDMMGDQIVPVEKTGTKYVVQKGLLNATEAVFAVATAPNTAIFLDGIQLASINTGATYQIPVTDGAHYIETSQPAYMLQLTGNGCEVAGEVLPTLDCSGSTAIRFIRPTDEDFIMQLVTKEAFKTGFLLNGSSTWVNSSLFQPVPGTNGAYVAASISFDPFQVITGVSNIIENTLGEFHMGFINGRPDVTGCRFGYFSDFGNHVNVRDTLTFCAGDTIVAYGKTIFNSQNFVVNKPSLTGCDTVVYVAAIQQNYLQIAQNIQFCPGTSVVINGATYTQPGTVIDTLLSATGCDTIVSYLLSTLPYLAVAKTIQICEGTAVTINGVAYNQPGIVLDTVSATLTCDTIFTYTIKVTSLVNRDETVRFCPGASVSVNGTNYFAPDTIQYLLPGNMACDTMVTVRLEYDAMPTTERTVVICPGSFFTINDIPYDHAALVQDTIDIPEGCDTLRITHIEVDVLPEPFLPADTLICPGQVLSFSSPFPATQWNTGEVGSSINLMEPGLVVATVLNSHNCRFQDSVLVKGCCSGQNIYIPNAFTPNGDGLNDLFCANAIDVCTPHLLEVYDRWGSLVFRSTSEHPCWDGTERGHDAPSDVYVWVVTFYSDSSKKKDVLKGDVTLIR